jgi:hypothetical protein
MSLIATQRECRPTSSVVSLRYLTDVSTPRTVAASAHRRRATVGRLGDERVRCCEQDDDRDGATLHGRSAGPAQQ